jgi:hypothetical protein
MFRLMRFRPSPAMVVACTALLISLGGVGYSAIRLPANSVTTKCLGGRADCMVRCLSRLKRLRPFIWCMLRPAHIRWDYVSGRLTRPKPAVRPRVAFWTVLSRNPLR